MSVYIVRIFVRIREMAMTNENLAQKFDQLEKRVSKHDDILTELVSEIQKMIEAPKPKIMKSSIGFLSSEKS